MRDRETCSCFRAAVVDCSNGRIKDGSCELGFRGPVNWGSGVLLSWRSSPREREDTCELEFRGAAGFTGKQGIVTRYVTDLCFAPARSCTCRSPRAFSFTKTLCTPRMLRFPHARPSVATDGQAFPPSSSQQSASFKSTNFSVAGSGSSQTRADIRIDISAPLRTGLDWEPDETDLEPAHRADPRR
jgi:hypothetical protein